MSKARLYHSTIGGRELDAHVHQVVFGKDTVWMPSGSHIEAYCKGESDYGFGVTVPSYTTDIKDAWKILDFMRSLAGPKTSVWKSFVQELVHASELPEGTLRRVGEVEEPASFEDIFWNLRPICICRAALEVMHPFNRSSDER